MPYELERVGTLISQNDAERLIKRIYSFVQVKSNSLCFPGWHAVTLLRRHIVDLVNRDYFACEKSDGMRALLYVICERGRSYFFFIDRKMCCYRILENEPVLLDGDYLLDGEVIITNEDKIEYSVFDTIIFQSNSVMQLNLLERLRLADKFIRHQLCHLFSFKVLIKKMYKAYGFAEAYESRFSLGHGNDGLIFTCVEEPYVFGTCNNLYKWKPPSLNTIDFQMRSENEDVYSLWCMGRGSDMVMIGYFFDFDLDNGYEGDDGCTKGAVSYEKEDSLHPTDGRKLNTAKENVKEENENVKEENENAKERNGKQENENVKEENVPLEEENENVKEENDVKEETNDVKEENVPLEEENEDVKEDNKNELLVEENENGNRNEGHKRLKVNNTCLINNHSESNNQIGKYHKKIGEFHFNENKKSICMDDYSIVKGKWELLRIREDKNTPNSFRVVTNIFLSMRENITYEDIVDHFEEIRRNWKRRESARAQSVRK
ncbi:mRNA capping enzyme, guanylyltransferase (alpha) subunit [Trachipleistophora hominis]|uniref:mRNA guanylyltransferase n=1 Tax=Trachipleistophora hominis TaxID=72359 RepID=L7JUX4_TRAHO|nr:mRNA capping enzyme, guanylyltransferase (alpha) subunit [Trachipleistophora hominis]